MMKAVILVLLLLALLPVMQGVPVVGLQMDGYFSNATFVAIGPGIVDSESDAFTVCLRLRLERLRGLVSMVLSMADEINYDGLFLAFRYKETALELKACKSTSRRNYCVSHPWSLHLFRVWTQVCIILKAQENRSAIDLFVDGMHVNSMEWSLPADESPKSLLPSSAIVLGQDQDGVLSNFEEHQAYSGSVTDLNVWTATLEAKDISAMAKCMKRATAIEQESLIIQWPEHNFTENWIVGNVSMTEINLDDPEHCLDDLLDNKLLITEYFTHNEFDKVCRLAKGFLPVALENYDQNVLDMFVATMNTLEAEESRACLDPKPRFQLGQRFDSLLNKWIDPFDRSNNVLQLQKTVNESKCAHHWGPSITAMVCTQRFACGMCHLGNDSWIKLKGLCDESVAIDGLFDRDLAIHGVVGNRPHFLGMMNCHLYFDKPLGRWVLQSLRPPFTSLMMQKGPIVPIGRHKWMLLERQGWPCEPMSNLSILLTLSQCGNQEFTCDSGYCVPLEKRCDSEIDCKDKSDETNCDYVRLGPDYAKEVMSSARSSGPVMVYVNVSILAFPEIETFELRLTANFVLNLRWRDPRLNFYDLNEATTLNSLSAEDRRSVWRPRLTFVNALGPLHSLVDEQTSSIVIKEADALDEDLQMAVEAMRFAGSNNSISMSREYYHDYQCHFNLRFYPFDTQVCVLVFEVLHSRASSVRLARDGAGVAFLGSRVLVEYEIQMETMETSVINDTSRAEVTVVFRRRMEYHITNTFLQTFILVCVGFMSLFFPIDNFTDRIMVTLTTLLVVATLTTSIHDSLPKTSYYKLIDWWLLYAINVLVLTMGFHTYVENEFISVEEELRKARSREEQNKTTIKVNRRCIKYCGENDATKGVPMKTQKEVSKAFARVKRINLCGKVCLLLSMVVVNALFLLVALNEYLTPAQTYLDNYREMHNNANNQ